MNTGRWTRTGAAIAAALLLFLDADAGTIAQTWPVEPNAAVLAANLPAGESAAMDITIAVAADGGVFLAWENTARDQLRLQKLNADGTRSWGATGVAVRSDATAIQPAGDRRILSNGPLDVFPTADGGAWIAWTEVRGPNRDLRAQRLDFTGAPKFAANGVLVFAGMSTDLGRAAVTSDEADGLDAAGILGTGELRLQHVTAAGVLSRARGGLLLDGREIDKTAPTVTHLPTGAVAVTWFAADMLRLQVVGRNGPRIRGPGGILATGALPGFPSIRVTGGSHVPKLLVTYVAAAGTTPHLLLARPGGVVVFDEKVAPGEAVVDKQLREPPEITMIAGVRRGLPVGIELHGITKVGTAMRYVRLPGGRWTSPETIVPPATVTPGMTGALAGPLWTWDMGNRSADGERLRLVGYRTSTADAQLVPHLGPWLALCPGFDDGSRLVRSGPWLYLTWVFPSSIDGSIRATRVAVDPVPGETEILATRIDELVVGVTDLISGERHLDVAAPSATLPATDSQGLRLLIGDDGGVKATMLPTDFQSAPVNAWSASFATQDGTVTGTVFVGNAGQGLTIHVANLPFENGDRALWLRIETATTARMATVLLDSDDNGGATFSGTAK